MHANSKSINEKYNSQEGGRTGFPIEPSGWNCREWVPASWCISILADEDG